MRMMLTCSRWVGQTARTATQQHACHGNPVFAHVTRHITVNGAVYTAMQASDEEAGGEAEDGYSSDESAEETVEQKKLRLGTHITV